MCQLLGMNASTPTGVMFSFAGLAVRADGHRDGFGIAYFEDHGRGFLVTAAGQARTGRRGFARRCTMPLA
jgi:glutamine amidotransferase